MTRILPSVRLAVATVVVGVSALVSIGASSLVSSTAASGATALPVGWELCVLQGVAAPATQADVADLDEWQLVEGGSTNNSNAYNPFNTRRTTDLNNNPLPMTMSSNGFPAFADWLSGCAATVATLFQPNMWSITAALHSGNVSPPGAFLAAVDQSQWCAPDANGTPCYENAILGVAGNIATAVLTGSSALDVYGNVKNDEHAYELSVLTVSSDQNTVTARNKDLAAALVAEQGAQTTMESAVRALGSFAIDAYVSSGLYVSSTFPTGRSSPNPFGPPDADGVVAHQYESIAASDLVTRDQEATAAYHTARDHVHDASSAVAAALSKLNGDGAAQTHWLSKLVADVATMQTAGACTGAVLTAAPAGSVPAPAATTTTTTTTTTAPPAQAPPTTTTTTTTTTLPVASAAPAVVPPTTTTTSTTAPPSATTTTTTTTTTVPPAQAPPTTTTTTTPASPAAGGTGGSAATTPPPPATANPAGFTALQGCMAVLAPPAT